jgi:hypothetical protein
VGFYLNTSNNEATFQADADGRVTGLVLHGGGKSVDAEQIHPADAATRRG